MERLRRQLQQLGLTEADITETLNVALETTQESVAVAGAVGELFCSTEDVLGMEWEPYTPNDFARLRRDWPTYLSTLPQDGALRQVYCNTRNAACHDPNHYAAVSTALTSVEGVRPVRLCSFPNSEEHADKAHLCPQTG